MSVPNALLGLLETGPSHGYELKRAYDARFGRDRPLRSGQVYSTLGRLQRDGQVTAEGVEPGGGPDRKLYAITEQGSVVLQHWLTEPEEPQPHLQAVLFTKIVLGLLTGSSPKRYLKAQRARHLQRMRELTAARRSGTLTDVLLADYALFHLEADLRWMETTAARLGELAEEVAR
jgi:DNA-binding PadR family transcriptional regulator